MFWLFATLFACVLVYFYIHEHKIPKMLAPMLAAVIITAGILTLLVGVLLGQYAGDGALHSLKAEEEIVLTPIFESKVSDEVIYVTKTNNTYRFKDGTITSEDVRFVDSAGTEPRLVKQTYQIASPLERAFFFYEKTYYTFYIPKGSVSNA